MSSLAELLFTGCRSDSQRVTLIVGILGQHRPGRPYILVGQRHCRLTFAAALNDGPQPSVFGRLGLFHVIHVSPCTLDQHGAQAPVRYSSTDVDQVHCAAAAELLRGQTQIGSKDLPDETGGAKKNEVETRTADWEILRGCV